MSRGASAMIQATGSAMSSAAIEPAPRLVLSQADGVAVLTRVNSVSTLPGSQEQAMAGATPEVAPVAGTVCMTATSAQIAAGHRQDGARDVTGLVRRQEEDWCDLFVERGVALHERRRGDLIDRLRHPGLFLGGVA